MKIPDFKTLANETKKKGFYWIFSEASFMHPNPRFYKYYWWVFWQGSPCDGRDFLNKKHRLPTKQYFDLIEKLHAEGQSYWVYNRKLPRRDPANPFNFNAKVWENYEWAPPFDEDTDEECRGYK